MTDLAYTGNFGSVMLMNPTTMMQALDTKKATVRDISRFFLDDR